MKRAAAVSPEVVSFPAAGEGTPVRAAYEHPWVIRTTHWLTAVSLFVLVGSGLQIFTAFPSFGPQIPQDDLVTIPEALRLGGWLAGALMWHFTFMWVFIGSGAVYLAYQFVSGRYRMVLFTHRDLPHVWPMVRHTSSSKPNLWPPNPTTPSRNSRTRPPSSWASCRC